tara:strand:- start:1023 stop:1775 length:753 start_codon:yes stop_codon:yes gene_type:complete
MHLDGCIFNLNIKYMNQTLEQLIKLQEIDQRLLEIKEYMGDLPLTVESEESELTALSLDNEQKEARLLEIDKDIRHHESEIDDFNSKLNKYKEQLFLVKSNKEYDAISQEIEHMKETISNSENIQLKFEEEKTDFKELVKLNSSKMESITESLANNRIELQSALDETTSEHKKLVSNRDKIFKIVEPSYLNTYEQLRISRELGLASILGKSCGGCYTQLPPQTVIEIKENNSIITCPSCSVLQYWDGAEE